MAMGNRTPVISVMVRVVMVFENDLSNVLIAVRCRRFLYKNQRQGMGCLLTFIPLHCTQMDPHTTYAHCPVSTRHAYVERSMAWYK